MALRRSGRPPTRYLKKNENESTVTLPDDQEKHAATRENGDTNKATLVTKDSAPRTVRRFVADDIRLFFMPFTSVWQAFLAQLR